MAKHGHRAPEGYRASDYPTFAVTVDNVILTMLDGRLHVLLVQRHADPYAGAWALPGGFKRPDETLDEAAARELVEETGVSPPARLSQLGAYGDPGRDPRTNVVTVAYIAVTVDVGTISAGSDADAARLWPAFQAVDTLDLAFDHERILRDAIERVADQLDQTDLAISFVGPTFTLAQLQRVYEELWGVDIDPANFQRSVRAIVKSSRAPMSYVEPTGERASSSPLGGRPPELYRAGPAWTQGPPIRRPRGAHTTGSTSTRGR